MAESTENKNTGKLIFYIIITSITLLGFLGNSLILVAMGHRRARRMSTSVYLAVLSVMDTLDLLSGVFTIDVLASDIWLEFDVRNQSLPWCWLCEYVYFSAPQISSWCIVGITLERTVVLMKPHR